VTDDFFRLEHIAAPHHVLEFPKPELSHELTHFLCRKYGLTPFFEPNDATTWLKVKGMVDSYLYTLWQRGALQGAKAEQAYFVNIGLNKTMTPADINNGLMIVEIGLAAVRPAEFIVLRFSHKLAQ
jgi:phage tail sheath protein FI